MKKWLFFVPILFYACSSKKSTADPEGDFKVLGYLHSYANLKTDFQTIDLSLITDLNLAFVHPDTTGHFEIRNEYKEIVAAAHEKGVRVFFSIGGGAPPAHLETLLATAQGQETLINGIVSLLETCQFDGVDIDLENDLINEHYAPFVYAAAKAVKAKGKLVSAALASWNADKIADSTLAQYDFINVMSYDATGPWNPERSGQHSPYNMIVNDFTYFSSERGVAPKKLLMGVPFYGYGFNGAPESMRYKDIITQYPGSELKDELNINGGTLYYNGIPTMTSKTKFAKDRGAGGIMIWQLLQDSNDEKSLLNAINQAVRD